MNTKQVQNLNIPASPGCYKFYNAKKKLIYVGKAVNLRSRILSYFRNSTHHTPAKKKMVSEITAIKWEKVNTEIEALLLETNLIKKHQPYYNILMRDDKRPQYIKINTGEEWPRVYTTRTIDKSGVYFGPFFSSTAVKEVLKIIRQIWPHRLCRTMPKKTCLYYRISKCPGMCENMITKKDYQKTIQEIRLFLEGRKGQILKNLKKQIEKELQIINRKSEINPKYKIQKKSSALDEYYNWKSKSNNKPPKNILILIQKLNRMIQILSSNRLVSVGEKYENDIVELAKTIGLPRIPKRIEGYDISNIFGTEAVGSMVVFCNGEPDKNEYRKFKIKNKKGGDVAMLKEILIRRLNHLKWKMPDLIIIDGGKAQLNAATSVLKTHLVTQLPSELPNDEISVISVSKGEHLRSAKAPDLLWFPGEKTPLKLPIASPTLHIIKRVRDEAHRFAISYHRKLKRKQIFK